MKAVVAAFNQEKALVGAFSVITNLRMELFEALVELCCFYLYRFPPQIRAILRDNLSLKREIAVSCASRMFSGPDVGGFRWSKDRGGDTNMAGVAIAIPGVLNISKTGYTMGKIR